VIITLTKPESITNAIPSIVIEDSAILVATITFLILGGALSKTYHSSLEIGKKITNFKKKKGNKQFFVDLLLNLHKLEEVEEYNCFDTFDF